MRIIAKRLKDFREGLGISQKKIAEKIGITQTSVYRYENDLADPSTKALLWYADYFDVSLDYIFGRTDNPQGKTFDYKPENIKEISKQNENLKEFINMCFDPKSSMNDRLKNALFQILSEEKEKKINECCNLR